ncbi:hypothetical protein GBA52_025732 [Prunus armeniaca]|nr:hypothetical protein GBA52_025732 [Prunus armeniaca]
MTSGSRVLFVLSPKRCVARRGICVFGESLSRLEREVGSEKKIGVERNEMVRGSIKLLKDAGSGLSKTLSEILVCPLSKQPLRFCEETNSLVSDSIGVSFPIKDGIPCLVPTDGKTLEADDTLKPEDAVKSSVEREADQGGSH